jgi:hypothetical protein
MAHGYAPERNAWLCMYLTVSAPTFCQRKSGYIRQEARAGRARPARRPAPSTPAPPGIIIELPRLNNPTGPM